MAKTSKVVAHLPATVELSRRKTKDIITLEIHRGEKVGHLVISKSRIEWWPRKKSVNVHRADWELFASVCEKHIPKRRSEWDSKWPKR
jgi:hypothetical protein